MKHFLIILSVILSSQLVHARYTCNDRDYLRSVLNELEYRCGSSVRCTAAGHDGRSIERAIETCVASGVSMDPCSRKVECNGTSQFCQPKSGHVGTTIENAIDHCVRSGVSRDQCSRRVECRDPR